MCLSLCAHLYICVSVCMPASLCVQLYICASVCPSVRICTCACLPMSVRDVCLCVRCFLKVWLCAPLRTTQLSTVSSSSCCWGGGGGGGGGGGHRFCLLFNALQYRQTHLTDILSNQLAQGQTRRLQ